MKYSVLVNGNYSGGAYADNPQDERKALEGLLECINNSLSGHSLMMAMLPTRFEPLCVQIVNERGELVYEEEY